MNLQDTIIMASVRRMRKKIENNLMLAVPSNAQILRSYINKDVVSFSSRDFVNLFVLGDWEKDKRVELEVIVVTEKEELPTFKDYSLQYVNSFSGTYAWFHIFIKKENSTLPVMVPPKSTKKKTSKKSTRKKI